MKSPQNDFGKQIKYAPVWQPYFRLPGQKNDGIAFGSHTRVTGNTLQIKDKIRTGEHTGESMYTQLIVLAGGAGLRFGGAGATPKPLAELHGSFMIEHVVRPFVDAGVRDIHVAAGCNFEVLHAHLSGREFAWHVHDTGADTNTGGRVKQVAAKLDTDTFFLCYADGLADLDVADLAAQHRDLQCAVTMTVCHPHSNYGIATLDGLRVTDLREKPLLRDTWVNGGFFVLDRVAIDAVKGDATSWERDTLPQLALGGQVAAYRHHGDWVTVDSQKELPDAEAFVQRRDRV